MARAVDREGQLALAARLRVDPPAVEYWHRTGVVPDQVRSALEAVAGSASDEPAA